MSKVLMEVSRRKRAWTRGYDPEIADEICERIAGGEVLEDICCMPGYPSRATVWRWLYLNDDFRDMYQLSIQANGLSRADDVAGVVKDALNGEISPNQASAAIKGLTWLAERHTPVVYAEKKRIEIHNSSTDKPATVTDQRQLARRIAFAMAKGRYAKDDA